eukprot:COSAG06_NODE_41628_length_389_cov_1.055172_1_plen_96_part_10
MTSLTILQVRNRASFCDAILYYKIPSFLPRQARDKRRESAQKRECDDPAEAARQEAAVSGAFVSPERTNQESCRNTQTKRCLCCWTDDLLLRYLRR